MSMPEQLKPVTPDAPALGITHSASLAHTSLPPRSFRMAFTRPVLIRESHSKSLRTIEPQNITRSKRISGYFSIAAAAMYVPKLWAIRDGTIPGAVTNFSYSARNQSTFRARDQGRMSRIALNNPPACWRGAAHEAHRETRG